MLLYSFFSIPFTLDLFFYKVIKKMLVLLFFVFHYLVLLTLVFYLLIPSFLINNILFCLDLLILQHTMTGMSCRFLCGLARYYKDIFFLILILYFDKIYIFRWKFFLHTQICIHSYYINDCCFDCHPLLARNLKFTNWIVIKNMPILFQSFTTLTTMWYQILLIYFICMK